MHEAVIAQGAQPMCRNANRTPKRSMMSARVQQMRKYRSTHVLQFARWASRIYTAQSMSRMLHGIRAIISNSASEQWRRRTPRVSPFVHLRDAGWLAWSALQRELLLKATLQRASQTRTLVLDWCDGFRDTMWTLFSRQNAAAITQEHGRRPRDMARWPWHNRPVTAIATERGRRNTEVRSLLPRHGAMDMARQARHCYRDRTQPPQHKSAAAAFTT